MRPGVKRFWGFGFISHQDAKIKSSGFQKMKKYLWGLGERVWERGQGPLTKKPLVPSAKIFRYSFSWAARASAMIFSAWWGGTSS